jgi:hypothetical protein
MTARNRSYLRERIESAFELKNNAWQFVRDMLDSFHNKTEDSYPEYEVPVQWEDLRFPATTQRQGATTKPDFDFTEFGLLFPQNDAAEVAYMIAQMPHSYKLGTAIKPHVYFVQTGATAPTFKIAYRWYENNGNPLPSFITLAATGLAFTYVSGNILQIATFPEIPGTGIDTLSSILDIALYRQDNVVTGDVLVKEFDIHYQIDSNGSNQEYEK